MRVLGTCINAKVGHHLAAQFVARQHPLNGLCDNALRMLAFKDLTSGAGFDAARITGVPVIRLVALFTRQLNFIGVYYDHIVAHIHVRCERRLVFTT